MNKFLSAVVQHFESKREEVFCRFVVGEDVQALRWHDIERSSAGFLAAYRSLDLPDNALILIFLRHIPQLYGSFLGAMLGGFQPSFLPCTSAKQDPALYWSSHSTLFDRIRPAAVVADRATLAEMKANGLNLHEARTIALEDVLPQTAAWSLRPEDDIALLQHSSGTTGLKKGVALSYRAIARQLDSYAAAIDLRQDDVFVSWLPLYHDMGLIACFLLPVYKGIGLVQLDPFEWLARPGRLFEHIARWDGKVAWLPNFAFEYLAMMCRRDAETYSLSRMRAFISCSETCRPGSFDRFATAFGVSGVKPEMLQCCYAMAETVFAVTQTDLGKLPRRLSCKRQSLERGQRVELSGGGANDEDVQLIECGGTIAGAAVTIVDEARRPLPPGVVGEIAISASYLFSGYNCDPERTQRQLVGDLYYSRDLGFVMDGGVYVLGRIDDQIIINGRNIYAHEIEDLLSHVTGLKRGRSVAIPSTDERTGTQGLVVVAEKLVTERPDAEISSEIMNRIFSVTNVRPKAVHLVSEGWLVKTTSGKISREMNAKKILQLEGTKPSP